LLANKALCEGSVAVKAEFPKWTKHFQKEYPKVWKAFQKLGDECHGAGPLDARTRRLVKVGIAAGAGSQGAVHSAVRNALTDGISPDEIRHVILLSITTIGFPNGQAALSWAEDLMGKSR
jgi:alkylhydroperoxidase/carboxymuconolactone decarboxylase family protein YurZ